MAVSMANGAKDSQNGQGVLAFGVEPARSPYRLRLARYHALAEAIAMHLGRRRADPQARLLDIGVGNGRTLRYLEPHGKLADRVTFVGLDLSPRRLTNLYKPHRWRLVQADARQRLPFEDGAFDVVVCEQVMEHLPDPSAVIRETARVLAPGGLFAFGVPTFPPGLVQIRRHLIPRLDRMRGVDRGHVQAFSKASAVSLLAGAPALRLSAARGFRIVSGGLLAPLERFEWWWRINRTIGTAIPSLCTEVQVLATKQ